jgi:hypothetical protein
VAALAEGEAKGSKPTFVSEHGYGNEEWLFRPEHMIDGWRYGFLQPALKAQKSLYGKALSVVLYTIDTDDQRKYVGRIDNLVVLDEEDAKQARAEFHRKGWLEAMRSDLAELGLSMAFVGPRTADREIVNCRYQPTQVHMLPEAVVAPSGDVTNKRGKNRYRFYVLDKTPTPIVGTHADPNQPLDPYSYQAAPIVHADRRHNRLQLLLVKMLRKRYGHDAVQFEVNGVDIILTRKPQDLFIEVKSQPDARLAIREALGQLFEYALFRPDSAKMPELAVVAPGSLNGAVQAYVNRLCAELKICIRYVSFDEHTKECPF